MQMQDLAKFRKFIHKSDSSPFRRTGRGILFSFTAHHPKGLYTVSIKPAATNEQSRNVIDINLHKRLIESNQQEYGRLYDLLTFGTPAQLQAAMLERNQLLEWLSQNAEFGYCNTKVDCNGLSPGCQRCGDGVWSCLFINGRCNGRCFYCPTPQDEDGPPVTNGLVFKNAGDYASYVAALNFSGVSISGGEPLMTPDLTISYLSAVRKRCGDDIHLWLYTNGTLLTADLCQRLHQAGLNEIRFDLGAVRYNLKKLRLAVGIIPTVTVEIPAVPQDEAQLRLKLVEMAESGVNHLNLHQMRLTKHNFGPLLEHNYTFLHGEKVTVLESELCALRTVRFGIEHGIKLPVNYCSFAYKRRFQHAAARRRAALSVCKADETVTTAGYLRTLTENGVNYSEAAILQNPSYRLPFEKILLETGHPLYLERRPLTPVMELSAIERETLISGHHLQLTARYENIESGLPEYF